MHIETIYSKLLLTISNMTSNSFFNYLIDAAKFFPLKAQQHYSIEILFAIRKISQLYSLSLKGDVILKRNFCGEETKNACDVFIAPTNRTGEK